MVLLYIYIYIMPYYPTILHITQFYRPLSLSPPPPPLGRMHTSLIFTLIWFNSCDNHWQLCDINGRAGCVWGEHKAYSLVPNIPVCRSECMSSCSQPTVDSNIIQYTHATFFVNVFFFKWPPVAILMTKNQNGPKFILYRISGHFIFSNMNILIFFS